MSKKILDKKTKSDLLKHKNNCYKNNIENRKDILNCKLVDKNIFNLENIIKDNIFYVNIKKFTGFEGNYYFNGKDPLVKTSLELLENKNKKIMSTSLYKYFNNFQPKNYRDLYNLSPENKLNKILSTQYFRPWLHKKPTPEFRAGLFGPKDISSIELRLVRLKNLITNIRQYGYIPNSRDIIEGYILLKSDDYRFIITGGHHRIGVLTSFYIKNIGNYENILVKYENKRSQVKIVRECDVEKWPGVKSGYINKESALEFFNSHFF